MAQFIDGILLSVDSALTESYRITRFLDDGISTPWVEHPCFSCITFDSIKERKKYISDYYKMIKQRRFNTLIEEGYKVDENSKMYHQQKIRKRIIDDLMKKTSKA